MRNYSLLLLLMLSFSSCGLFKKSTVDKSSSKIETVERKEIETDVDITDKSVITEKVSIDTTVKTPAKTIEQVTEQPVNKDSLQNGLQVIRNDLVDVVIQIDSATGKIKTIVNLKPQTLIVRYDKTTTTQNDIRKNERRSENESKSTKSKERLKQKSEEPQNTFWIFAIAIGVVVLVLAFIGRKLKWF